VWFFGSGPSVARRTKKTTETKGKKKLLTAPLEKNKTKKKLKKNRPPNGGYGQGAPQSPPPVDPWKSNPAFSNLRRQIYNYLGDYAISGGGPQYRTDALYVWSVGTW
jgi:hypothetical protein